MAVLGRFICLSVALILDLVFVNLVHSKGTLRNLGEDDWRSMLEGEWMVEFYAPWCPACKALQPVWDELSTWSDDLGINVAKIDVTTSPGLSGRFVVTALPTIFHVLNGEFRQYRGGRDKDSLISFVEDKKWKDIEAVPSWKSPASFQMSVIAQFFKVSTILRSMHHSMVEDFGLPTWGSYLVFAVITIIIGALLGLVLVCIIDCIYPPSAPRPTLHSILDNYQGDEGDDLIDEAEESEAYDEVNGRSRSQTQSEAEESQTEDDEKADNEDNEGIEKSGLRRRRED